MLTRDQVRPNLQPNGCRWCFSDGPHRRRGGPDLPGARRRDEARHPASHPRRGGDGLEPGRRLRRLSFRGGAEARRGPGRSRSRDEETLSGRERRVRANPETPSARPKRCSTTSNGCGTAASPASTTSSPRTPEGPAMPITSVTQDPEALTLTVVADFAVPVRRLWDAYADPRQIERFWGPPGWPATFTRHDVTVGGRSNYAMTGPDGERSGGYWSSSPSRRARASRCSTASPTTGATRTPRCPGVHLRAHRRRIPHDHDHPLRFPWMSSRSSSPWAWSRACAPQWPRSTTCWPTSRRSPPATAPGAAARRHPGADQSRHPRHG